MKKSLILEQLIQKTARELALAQSAYDSSKELREADDMKSEGKYDTRSIEAGYLAGAQLKRVEELKIDLESLREIKLTDYSAAEPIAIGALTELEVNGKKQKYFLCSTIGGQMLKIGNDVVMVISAFSPIGDALLGLKEGDRFELETPKEIREYCIKSVS